MRVKKGQRNHVLCPFSVGANCVRPRAFTERPYEDDFLSVGKTCFMEDTPSGVCFLYYSIVFLYSEGVILVYFLNTFVK